jgi:competence protein ComEC
MSVSSVLRLKVLDVGEGDAIILLLPNSSRAIVLDAFDGERVLEELEREEVDELLLFVSHSDNDHINGVQHIIDNFGGEFFAFFYNRDRLKAELSSKYRSILTGLATATREQANPYSSNFNTNLNFDPRLPPLIPAPVTIEVLHPTFDEQSSFIGTTTNEGSGVLRVVYTTTTTSWSILFAADVQLMGISCMMHRYRADLSKLNVNVLKFPHHGAWPTTYPAVSQFVDVPRRTMAEFLDAVDPHYVVLSVGHDNPHGHVVQGVFDVMEAVRIGGGRLRRILCTQITRTCLPPGGTCLMPHCAGDVEIRIGGTAHGGIEVLPQGTTHSARILSLTTIADAGCGQLI